ncbi:MAG: TusE/DsrC/DsvC family sulfur relay protein [Paracoccaceae bacterium]|nr:TusE/DsrC/DsvC family sulfur relay protein [Maritimibacter sp.]
MTLTVKDTQLETDENGFLRDPAAWNEDVMQALVAQHEAEGHKPLSETAKGLVGYMREHYEETETVPGMHKIIEELGRAHGESFAEGEDYKAFLYEMFPHGPVQMLAKLAGLPNPGVENES